jgi:hypothetical protein
MCNVAHLRQILPHLNVSPIYKNEVEVEVECDVLSFDVFDLSFLIPMNQDMNSRRNDS